MKRPIVRIRWIHWAMLLVLAWAPGADAYVPEAEGQPAVGFSATWRSLPRLGQPARLRFSMAGRVDTTAVGVAHVRLPEGLQLLSGDTLYRGHPQGSTRYWSIVVVPQRNGRFEITGTLAVTLGGKETVDELDLALDFQVVGDSASVAPSRLTRAETVREGKRFRYGGKYLVPIEAPEQVTQDEIERSGTKANTKSSSRGRCANFGSKGVVEAEFVVFVSASGRVAGARPLRTLPPPVERAAREALEGWVFEPTRIHGRPVSDWLQVTVTIETD